MCCLVQSHVCVEKGTECLTVSGLHGSIMATCWVVCWHCLNIHECLSVPPSSMSSSPPCMLWIALSPPTTIPVLRLVHPHDVALCHWVFGRSQDHSGALMAEEFKACLISLGYDVENDKQVGGPGQDGGKELVFVRPLSRTAERRSLPVTCSSSTCSVSFWIKLLIIYYTISLLILHHQLFHWGFKKEAQEQSCRLHYEAFVIWYNWTVFEYMFTS